MTTLFSFSSSSLLALASGASFKPKVPESDSFWQPVGASNFVDDVDALYSFILHLSVVVVLALVGALVLLLIKYRVKTRAGSAIGSDRVDQSVPLQVVWSIPPVILFTAVFAWGFDGYLDMRQAPSDSVQIKAEATQSAWKFTYPNGESNGKLHVPLDHDVRILLHSGDVQHGLSIPAFRVNMGAEPGRYTDLWFRPTRQGSYPVYCSEYCGTKHSEHLSEATVQPYSDWLTWMDGLAPQLPPVDEGKKQYEAKGCKTCHSIDGTRKVGPTWKGLFGSKVTFNDGTSGTADEAYIRRSIKEPLAQVVEGFAPAMPTVQMTDKQLDGLVAYIKSLK